MLPTTPVGTFYIAYTDINGVKRYATVRAHDFIEAASEFKAVYSNCYKMRGEIMNKKPADYDQVETAKEAATQIVALPEAEGVLIDAADSI